uniref:Rna-binding protein 5 n=1 Tax=Anopheles coluzzii TaxID=1518534 RepID=A0A8W7P1Y3_ANOCL
LVQKSETKRTTKVDEPHVLKANEMDFSPSPDSDTSGYYRNRCRRDERDRGNRGRSKERYRNAGRYSRSRSRSYSRERYSYPRQRSNEREAYRDVNEQPGYDEGGWDSRDRYRGRSRERDRDRRSRERDRYRDRRDRDRSGGRRGGYSPSSMDDGENFDSENEFFYQQKPNNNIIIRGLAPQVTEADINSDLIQCGLQALHGVLVFNGQHAIMQYTFSMPSKFQTDWYCAKCYAFNFKRRENCFKCHASREDSEIGGDGSDEMSNILTKKIMLRNLDVLTNEESVLGVMQKKLPPELVPKIGKVVICRDPLTSISRGMCYLHFDNLVDSMNTHNALKELDPPLRIDNREVIVSYCMDTENRNLMKPQQQSAQHQQHQGREGNHRQGAGNQNHHHHHQGGDGRNGNGGGGGGNGNFQSGNNSGYRGDGGGNGYDRSSSNSYGHHHNSHGMHKGSGRATPDTSLYQYDETSGFYYDPTTGLYYDANSQYYYNSETSSYLYWDPEKQTYVAAPASSGAASGGGTSLPASGSENSTTQQQQQHATLAESAERMEKSKAKEQAPPQDKVKVAKKIVKDMEKWAKQLNQKKDYSVIQPPARIEEATLYSSLGPSKPLPEPLGGLGSGGYADVGFSLLEKKERAGAGAGSSMMGGTATTNSSSTYPAASGGGVTKSITSATSAYGGSDSDNDYGDGGDGSAERELVDFDRLTCLLCKRAFQSQEILMKHVKMSSLHKENLQKLNANFRAAGGGSRGAGGGGGGGGSSDGGSGGPYSGLQYRDRAKERRAKYGEDEAPPVNRSKERFQREIEKQTQSQSGAYPQGTASAVPIGQNNIGNKLLQKMGWSEGQGLGRANQGRVNIIEAEARVANVGLGIKASAAAQFGRTTDDYKTYIKKMMKSRYEQVDVKD